MLRIIAAAAVLLMGVGSAQAEIALTKSQQAKVRAAVSRDMLDAQSARWGIMRAGMENGVLWVCGTVNAKNRFGGYVGFLPNGAYMGRFTAAGAFEVEATGPEALGFRCGRLGVKMQ